ncbi:MAG: T9SS type A sorting domain-containing protein, partial [Candidatus Krumholzibacteriota bacterium]|nr:T9SS type A sorting domain-containing protein [Candidatus Krumholzibacteriota bacterium]
VGGSFTTAGGSPAFRVARWDGSSWSALGTGVTGDVRAIAISGSDVYVGGSFTAAGGSPALRVARWDGSSWFALGGGLSETVNAIAIDGSSVYVGGAFTTAGGSGAFRIARWNGSSWSVLGSGTSGTVNAIAVDGSELYVGGEFTTAGGLAAARIARWDGSNWSSLGSGTTGIVRAVDAIGGDVHVGGDFTVAGTNPSFYFGRYNPVIVSILITSFRAELDVSGVKLWWDIFADEDVEEFRIYRREEGGVSYERINARDRIPPDARTYIDTSIEFGKTYQYILGVARPDGSEVRSLAVDVKTASHALSLAQNYPNPFNPSTTISFTLPGATHVNLVVVDAQGKIVTTLMDGTLVAGPQEVQWNGRDARGNAVSSGVYFYRLQAGKRVQTRKMVLIK